MVILVLVDIPIAMLNEVNYGVVLNLLESEESSSSLILAFFDAHKYGIMIVLIFWGLWLFPFGYLADSLIFFFDRNFPISFSNYLFQGEMLVAIWLTIRGINVEKWVLQKDIYLVNT